MEIFEKLKAHEMVTSKLKMGVEFKINDAWLRFADKLKDHVSNNRFIATVLFRMVQNYRGHTHQATLAG